MKTFQKAFELSQNHLEEKLTTLQSQIDKLSSLTTPSSSSSNGKRKGVVTSTLSISLFNCCVVLLKTTFFQNKMYSTITSY